MAKLEFPRHLYKGNGSIEWNYGLSYDRIYVKNKKEYDNAIEKGFIDDFDEALFGDPIEDTDEDDIIVEENDVETVETTVKPSKSVDEDF